MPLGMIVKIRPWDPKDEKISFNPLPDNKILDWSKEFADDNSNLTKGGRKLSKQVENSVGKREIARYEQFLLFPRCFQKACFPGVSKGVIVWEWVKNPCHEHKNMQSIPELTLYQTTKFWT